MNADRYTLTVAVDNGRYVEAVNGLRAPSLELTGDKATWDHVERALLQFRGCTVHVFNHFNGSVTVIEVTPQPFAFNFSVRAGV